MLAFVFQAQLGGNHGADSLPLPGDVLHLYEPKKGVDGARVLQPVGNMKIYDRIDHRESFRENPGRQLDSDDGCDVYQYAQKVTFSGLDQVLHQCYEPIAGKTGEETGSFTYLLPASACQTKFFDELPFIQRNDYVVIRHRI